jgi:hypothetical protein
MAYFGRKKERLTMQQAVEEAMAQMGMSQLIFVVTADLATKISSLMWKAHNEELSQGIHPFCAGETNPNAVASLQELTRRYDLITEGNAAPSLSDAHSLVGILTTKKPSVFRSTSKESATQTVAASLITNPRVNSRSQGHRLGAPLP